MAMSILNSDDHPARQVELAKNTKKTAYCRCWKSSKMPFCDGSHRDYNKVTGDNLGPLIINWCIENVE